MKKINKYGKLPINARITIDYSKEKPKITFGYIAAKQQKSINYINFFSLSIIILIFIFIIGFFTYLPNTQDKSPIVGTCSFYEQYEFGDNRITAYSITCGSESYLLKYEKGKGIFPLGTKSGFYNEKTSKLSDYGWIFDTSGKPWYFTIIYPFLTIIIAIGIYALVIIFLLGGSYIIGWGMQYIPYINKKVNKWIPVLNAKLSTVRYIATFKKCPENKIIEIPLFKNIFLDYDATEEFSKYLLRVEIREHPFTMLSKRYHFNRRQKEKYKKKKNVFLWNARFIFKKQPKRGQLEVRWK